MHLINFKWLVAILFLILLINLGFLIYLGIKTDAFGNLNKTAVQNSTSEDLSLFDNANANLSGKVTKVEGNKIYFENSRGVSGEAEAINGIAISDLSKGIGTPSADLKKIELNKIANMIFTFQNGKYLLLSITYPQP